MMRLWLLLLYVVVLIVIAIAVFIIVMGPALIAGAVGGGMDSLAYKIVYAVLNPISVFCSTFGTVSIYQFLLKRKKKAVQWKF